MGGGGLKLARFLPLAIESVSVISFSITFSLDMKETSCMSPPIFIIIFISSCSSAGVVNIVGVVGEGGMRFSGIRLPFTGEASRGGVRRELRRDPEPPPTGTRPDRMEAESSSLLVVGRKSDDCDGLAWCIEYFDPVRDNAREERLV
jgi:hypothetical protein